MSAVLAPVRTPPKERGMLFSAPMVRALLAGTKTQTRRAVKNLSRVYSEIVFVSESEVLPNWWPYATDDDESQLCSDGNERPMACPYGKVGDRLWVRETWACLDSHKRPGARLAYRADTPDGERVRVDAPWIPAIHMNRWASRILLEITDVRVERLQDISEADAIAEGIVRWPLGYRVATSGAPNHESRSFDSAVAAYRWLWEDINGAGSWAADPWVWVVSFRRLP